MPLSTQGCQPDHDDVCGRTLENLRGDACLMIAAQAAIYLVAVHLLEASLPQ